MGRVVLIAGCAHKGIANIIEAVYPLVHQEPHVVFGGFHFFELDPEDQEDNDLIMLTGLAVQLTRTAFYTGHCTGDYAYERLEKLLQDRLHPMRGGTTFEV